jgi:hypothetical protein
MTGWRRGGRVSLPQLTEFASLERKKKSGLAESYVPFCSPPPRRLVFVTQIKP